VEALIQGGYRNKVFPVHLRFKTEMKKKGMNNGVD